MPSQTCNSVSTLLKHTPPSTSSDAQPAAAVPCPFMKSKPSVSSLEQPQSPCSPLHGLHRASSTSSRTTLQLLTLERLIVHDQKVTKLTIMFCIAYWVEGKSVGYVDSVLHKFTNAMIWI